MSKKKIVYLEVLRVLAAIMVITIHVSSQNWKSIDITSMNWLVMTFYNSVARIAVPLFVMISGAIFLSREKGFKLNEILKKYSLRIFVILYSWSFIYAIVYSVIYKESFGKFISRFIGGHYHLWYLFMLIGLYLILPFLKKITENKKLVEYFLVLSFVLTSVLPTLIKFPVLNVLSDPYGSLHYRFTIGYSSYFMLGYYLHNYPIDRKYRNWIYLLGVFGVLFTFMSTVFMSQYNDVAYNGLLNNFCIGVVFESIAVFIGVKNCRLELSKKQMNIIDTISKYSLGIYLVHVFVLDIMKMFGFHTLSFSILLSMPILILATFLMSLLVSYLLHKIAFINKYLL